jgi:hypothetical protein
MSSGNTPFYRNDSGSAETSRDRIDPSDVSFDGCQALPEGKVKRKGTDCGGAYKYAKNPSYPFGSFGPFGFSLFAHGWAAYYPKVFAHKNSQ